MPNITFGPDGGDPPGPGGAPQQPAAQPLASSQPAVPPALARDAPQPFEVVDSRGRRIVFRRLEAWEDFDLTYLLGAQGSGNPQLVFQASVAYGIRSVDGVEVSRPTTLRELRAMIMRLGSPAIQAVIDKIEADAAEMLRQRDEALERGDPMPEDGGMDRAKNSQGTLPSGSGSR